MQTVKNPPVAPAKAIQPRDSHLKNPRRPRLLSPLESFVDAPTEAGGAVFSSLIYMVLLYADSRVCIAAFRILRFPSDSANVTSFGSRPLAFIMDAISIATMMA